MDSTAVVGAVVGAAATGLVCMLAAPKQDDGALSSSINELKLAVLAIQQKDIQTLCGASGRKDWLNAHPGHKEWAEGLQRQQQANAVAAPARPADAVNKALYDAAEQNQLESAVAALAAGYNPNVR